MCRAWCSTIERSCEASFRAQWQRQKDADTRSVISLSDRFASWWHCSFIRTSKSSPCVWTLHHLAMGSGTTSQSALSRSKRRTNVDLPAAKHRRRKDTDQIHSQERQASKLACLLLEKAGDHSVFYPCLLNEWVQAECHNSLRRRSSLPANVSAGLRLFVYPFYPLFMNISSPIFPSMEIRLILFSIEWFMESSSESRQRLFGVTDIFSQDKSFSKRSGCSWPLCQVWRDLTLGSGGSLPVQDPRAGLVRAPAFTRDVSYADWLWRSARIYEPDDQKHIFTAISNFCGPNTRGGTKFWTILGFDPPEKSIHV